MSETGVAGPPGSGGSSRILLAWELRGAETASDAAEARLRGIRALLAVLEPAARLGLPTDVPGWRSPAAAAYAEQLRGLHAELAGILAVAHSAETSAWHELAGWQGECERLGWLLRQAAEVASG